MPHARIRAALVGVVLACLLAVVPAAAASAHDYLVESTPSAGSTLTAPLENAALTFNDRVLDLSGDGSSSLVQVTGTANRHYETGCPTISDRTVTAPVALGAAGAYTLKWQIVSADGHTVSGTIPFRYEPPAGTAAAPGGDGPPACAAGAAASGRGPSASTATPGAGATATDASGSGGIALVIGIGVGIVVLALIGVLLVVFTGRRRPAQPPADEAP